DATPERLRVEPSPAWDEQVEALATRGATPDLARALVQAKWEEPTRTIYKFTWFVNDLKERLDKQAVNKSLASEPSLPPVQPASAADPDEDDAEAWLAARKAERVALDNSVYAPDVPEVAPSPHIPGKALDAWQSVYELIKRQYGSNEK